MRLWILITGMVLSGVVLAACSDAVAPDDSEEPPFPPPSRILDVGDTVAGPVDELPNVFGLRVPPGNPVDIRLTNGEDHPANSYDNWYTATLHAPDGSPIQNPTYQTEIRYHDLYFNVPRRQFVDFWSGITDPEGDTLTIVVDEENSDRRGALPQWYGLAIRPAGPIIGASFASSHHLTWSLQQGAWDSSVVDTLWVWNEVDGDADWSAFSDDPRVTLEPANGILPVGDQSDGAVPSNALPVVVRIDDRRPMGSRLAPIHLRADGDDWGDARVWVVLSLYDPEIATVYDDPDEGVHDLTVHPDGSIVMATTSALLTFDEQTGRSTEIPSSLYPGGPAVVEMGSDTSLYVVTEEQLLRIRPDGSETVLVTPDSLSLGQDRELQDVSVTPDGTLFLLEGDHRDSRLWMLGPGSAPSLVAEPEIGCCESIAYDPMTEQVYLAGEADGTGRLLAFDPSTGELHALATAPGRWGPEGTAGRLETIAVGASGTVYALGDLENSDVFIEFDPRTTQWNEVAWGPPFIGRFSHLAVGNGLLLAEHEGNVLSLPLEDRPAF